MTDNDVSAPTIGEGEEGEKEEYTLEALDQLLRNIQSNTGKEKAQANKAQNYDFHLVKKSKNLESIQEIIEDLREEKMFQAYEND